MVKQLVSAVRRQGLFAITLYAATCFPPFVVNEGNCQNIGINDAGALPNSKAMLDVDVSTNNMGILIPRLTTAQRTAIAGLGAGDEGLTVYDETTNSYWLWDGSAWVQFAMSGSGWMLSGNSLSGSEFIGSTNGQPFIIRTNNTERMRILSSGEVGIGLSNPAYTLEINGSFGFGNGTAGTYRSRTETRVDAGLQGSAGAQSGFFETDAPSPAADWPVGAGSWWHLLDIRHSNPANNYALQFAGSFFDQNLYFRKTNNNPAQAWSQILTTANGVINSCGSTNYIPKMTSASSIGCSQIYDDGTNVGIGTGGPGYKLHVLGDIYANGGWFRVSGNQGLYWESWGPGWYVQDGTWLRTYNNASIWANTGVIGTNGSFSSGYGGTAGPAGGAIIAGTVGIGTSTPGYTVHVYSAAAIGGTSLNTTTHYGTSGVALAGNNLSGSNAYNAIEGYTVGTYSGTWGSHNVGSGTGYGTMGLTASGDGIGVYGQYPGGAGWAVWGQGWAGGTTNWWNASDERLKKNIATIPNALNMILSLRGVQYEFRVDEYKDLVLEQGVQTGFIAQEVEKVLPNAVLEKNVPKIQTTKPNSPVESNQYKFKVLSYSSVIPVLVEGMKEQQAIIDEHKKQMEAQQKLIEELQKEIDALKKE